MSYSHLYTGMYVTYSQYWHLYLAFNPCRKLDIQKGVCNIHQIRCTQHLLKLTLGASYLMESVRSQRMFFNHINTEMKVVAELPMKFVSELITPPGLFFPLFSLIPRPRPNCNCKRSKTASGWMTLNHTTSDIPGVDEYVASYKQVAWEPKPTLVVCMSSVRGYNHAGRVVVLTPL